MCDSFTECSIENQITSRVLYTVQSHKYITMQNNTAEKER